MRRRFDLWLALSLIILAGLGILGTWNALNDLQGASTRLQLATSVASLGYGLLSLVAIPGLLIGWRGLKTILRLWLVAISATGGLAPVAWGGASAGAGIAALILTFLIALVVIWVVRRAQVAP